MLKAEGVDIKIKTKQEQTKQNLFVTQMTIPLSSTVIKKFVSAILHETTVGIF